MERGSYRPTAGDNCIDECQYPGFHLDRVELHQITSILRAALFTVYSAAWRLAAHWTSAHSGWGNLAAHHAYLSSQEHHSHPFQHDLASPAGFTDRGSQTL